MKDLRSDLDRLGRDMWPDVEALRPETAVSNPSERPPRGHRRGLEVLLTSAAAAVVIAALSVALALGKTAPSTRAAHSAPPIPSGTGQAALATSAARLKFLDDLRNGAAANPQRYGGVATNGDANITLCDNGSGADPGTDTPVAALRATGAQVTIHTCAHSLNELNKVLAEVATSTIFSSNGVTLSAWGIDYGRNAVEIGVDTIPAGFANKVAALWGDAVYVTVAPTAQLQ